MQVEQYHKENDDASTSNPSASTKSHNINTKSSLFYELELRENHLHILKRYTDIKVIGAGAQGLVLYAFNLNFYLIKIKNFKFLY